MIRVEDWAEIRRLHRAEGLSARAVARQLGITSYNRNYPDSEVYNLHNRSGSGTTAYSNGGGRIWDMKSCTSLDLRPDDCSDWWTDNHDHG
ncbi:hypothetical protein [Streptomyces goshikiensis]|uniref:hypothetical protein n=1 Tax=Streptomyces goshikiensis TaxID=1942 RepID=UPI0033A3AB68